MSESKGLSVLLVGGPKGSLVVRLVGNTAI